MNRYSFFKSLETNLLPPSQIQISVTLTDDNDLIYRTATSEDIRVIVTKFVLWIPRLLFNSSCKGYVLKNYMVPTSWTYLREMVQTLNNINHIDNNFKNSPSILNAKYVFVFFQRSNKMASQNNNPYLFDTFK